MDSWYKMIQDAEAMSRQVLTPKAGTNVTALSSALSDLGLWKPGL